MKSGDITSLVTLIEAAKLAPTAVVGPGSDRFISKVALNITRLSPTPQAAGNLRRFDRSGRLFWANLDNSSLFVSISCWNAYLDRGGFSLRPSAGAGWFGFTARAYDTTGDPNGQR